MLSHIGRWVNVFQDTKRTPLFFLKWIHYIFDLLYPKGQRFIFIRSVKDSSATIEFLSCCTKVSNWLMSLVRPFVVNFQESLPYISTIEFPQLTRQPLASPCADCLPETRNLYPPALKTEEMILN